MTAYDDLVLKKLDGFSSQLEAQLLSSATGMSHYEWIRKNCKINGRPYSEKDHEYQRDILDDQSRVIRVKKSAQIGVSVLSILKCFAHLGLYRGFTILYILPNATFSQTFNATRITPLLQECQALLDIQDRTVDSTSVKKFGISNFLHNKGAVSKSASISVDADYLVKDEVDFMSDMSVLTSFSSRLLHSPYKFDSEFSTPTVPEYGIDRSFSESMKKIHMAKCVRCSYRFQPKFEMIIAPGLGKGEELKHVTKRDIMRANLDLSYMECPKCRKNTTASLQYEHREWVVENPEDNFEASGYHVQPFSLPNIQTIPNIIKERPNYYRWADYVNNVLGETAADADNSFGKEELLSYFSTDIPATDTAFGYLGVDMGLFCHIVVLKRDREGHMYVPEAVSVPLTALSAKINELRVKHNVRLTVYDLYPYTDTILRVQRSDYSAWGCQFTEKKTLDLFNVRIQDDNSEKAIDRMRVIDAKRDRCLDAILEDVREGKLAFRRAENTEIFIEHMCSLKRLSRFDKRTGELRFAWVKTTGEDHFFLALVYAYIAVRLRGVSSGFAAPVPFLVSTIKVKNASI